MGRKLTIVELPTALGAPPNAPRTAPPILRHSPGVQQLAATCDVQAERVAVPQSPPTVHGGLSTMIARTNQIDLSQGTPIFFGGDHTASLASVNAVAEGSTTGVLWIDAHPDYNTRDTSPSGNLHGMVLASLLGDGPRPEWQASGLAETNIALVGVRSIDPGERRRLQASNIAVFTMEDIRQEGFPTILLEAWDVVTENTEHVHVSLDLDVFDPFVAPGVSTRVLNGLSTEEAELLATWLAGREQPLDSIDIVELNPLFDNHCRTSDLAGRILQTVFAN